MVPMCTYAVVKKEYHIRPPWYLYGTTSFLNNKLRDVLSTMVIITFC